MSAQTTGVLAVMGHCAAGLQSIADECSSVFAGDMAAQAQKMRAARATVEGLINALSVLADAAEARGIPVDAARAALTKARGDA